MRIIYVDGFIRRADFFSRSRLCDKEKDEKDIPEADDDLNVHERMHIYRHRSFSSLLPLPSLGFFLLFSFSLFFLFFVPHILYYRSSPSAPTFFFLFSSTKHAAKPMANSFSTKSFPMNTSFERLVSPSAHGRSGMPSNNAWTPWKT